MDDLRRIIMHIVELAIIPPVPATSSSAATIPVTLRGAEANGVRPSVAGSVVPLSARIHLADSTMKIVLFSATMMTITGTPIDDLACRGFVLVLGTTMVAAPGVPGGAIMAAAGLLRSMLGFDETAVALVVATYIAIGSFGTATNVTGDGAIAVVMNKLIGERTPAPVAGATSEELELSDASLGR